MVMGNLEESASPTAVRKLCGHTVSGPSGVHDQSKARMQCPISPPPTSQSSLFVAIEELNACARARLDMPILLL
jgi:hypothetical protein